MTGLLALARKLPVLGLAAAVVLALAVGACGETETETETAPWHGKSGPGVAAAPTGGVNPRLLRRFQPLDDAPLTEAGSQSPELVALGSRLFGDTILSGDQTVSCSSCHDISKWGADGRAVSIGVHGQRGLRNAPSVFNAAGSFRQFWDGRADKVEDQALGPILNPREMALPSADEALKRLGADPSYAVAFRKAFPREQPALTFANVGIAIGAFERTLVTPSRWDRFLSGDRDALSTEEKEGLKTFLDVGCMVCHTGKLLGGSMFERAGVVEPWPNQLDQGRYATTHDEGDRMMFKVPSLRNVTKTAPYFHDGSVDELEAAVRMMGRHQLGLELSDRETHAIVTWLGSLANDTPPSRVVSVLNEVPKTLPARRDAPMCKAGDCRLRSLMDREAEPAMAAGDADRLAAVFARIGALAPREYGKWSTIAASGANAARLKDLPGARAACQACHSTYRERYRDDALSPRNDHL